MTYALKSYPMNANVNPESRDTLIQFVPAARNEVGCAGKLSGKIFERKLWELDTGVCYGIQ
jgi:hypothetical protein